MTSHPDQIDAEIKKTLTTLFHSYDARGNDLAIAQAHAAVKRLMLEGRITELNSLGYDKRLDDPILYVEGDKAISRADRIKNLDGEIKEMQG